LEIISLLKKAGGRVMSMVRPRYEPDKSNGFNALVCKRAAEWPYSQFVERLLELNLDSVPDWATRIEAIRQELIAEHRGKSRSTKFRHELVRMDEGACLDGVSSPIQCVWLLYQAVRSFRPATVVEIGSAFGVGSMSIAEALSANGGGRLHGIEFEDWRCDIANRNLARHWKEIGGVICGLAEQVLPEIIAGNGLIDFAFVDATHKYNDTMCYHRMLRAFSSPGAIALFDDINWSEGMRRFWRDVLADDSVTDCLLINDRWGFVRYRGNSEVGAAS
jgi:predicted O-methyltransferase YrrM